MIHVLPLHHQAACYGKIKQDRYLKHIRIMDHNKQSFYRQAICCLVIVCTIGFAALPGTSSAQGNEREIANHLSAIKTLSEQALEASRQAAQATSITELKRYTDNVYETVWGMPSGLANENATGAATSHGWKTRWQTDTDDFELETPEKFGVEPPEINDPSLLGIIGRGRHVRKLLVADSTNVHHEHVVASLNNVIGWMRMDYAPARGGMPRVDLTYHWDAPSEFWQSTADTGWMFEAYSQAFNILKTNYNGDLALAKKHAAAMTALIEKTMQGEDANGNDRIEPVMMEGGLATAMQHAKLAGLNVD